MTSSFEIFKILQVRAGIITEFEINPINPPGGIGEGLHKTQDNADV